MKLFFDSADISLIEPLARTGIIDGITTNPTSLSAIQRNPRETIQQLCDLMAACPGNEKTIHVEVSAFAPEAVYEQACDIAAMNPALVIKIPAHIRYYQVIKKLIDKGIHINATLVFRVAQGIVMAQLGVHYISPFIGRLDDTGESGITLINQLVSVFTAQKINTKILAASIRTIDTLETVMLAGADIITVAPHLLTEALTHQLTDQGIEKFLSDWRKSELSL